VQLAFLTVFNFLLVTCVVYFEMMNSKFMVNKVGLIYFTVQAVVSVISLLDWFPGAKLDTNFILKFDYL
jgi:phosphatidylglycerophosphate synthase